MASTATDASDQSPPDPQFLRDVYTADVSNDLSKTNARRRRHQSAWNQPAPGLPSATVISVQDNHLYGIAFCLQRLELSVLQVITVALDNEDQSLFGWNDSSYYKGLLPQKLVESTVLKFYRGHPTQEQELKQQVEKSSPAEVYSIITDTVTLPYLSRLFVQTTSLNQSARARQLVIDNSPDFTIATDYIEWFGEAVSKTEYADYCIKEFNRSLINVRHLYDVTLELRDHVRKAASRNLLDDLSLEVMKRKLLAIERPFKETCGELRLPVERLVHENDAWWETSTPEALSQDTKSISTAYQPSPGVNATISFMVPLISVISSIPIFVAWRLSTHRTGTYLDADFYQILAGSSMQLLSMLTTMIPTLLNVRLARLSWYWTWILASFSTACAIIAVPLYLYAPSEWSMVLSFAASVGQSFIILQLIFVL